MASGDASLANSRAAQRVVDHLNGEGAGLKSPALIPFYEEAKAEAAGDALVGIEHDDAWIKARARELYRESKARKPVDELPEYISQKDLSDVIKKLGKDEYGNEEAQGVFNCLISDYCKQAEVATRETISREDIIKEQVAKRTKEIEKELAEKSWQERMKTNKVTLTFLRSAMLCLLIPIVGAIAPSGAWKLLQIIPLIGVVWLNWKPMRDLNKMMKDLKNEHISQS
jgi:hypothetical protein